MDQAVCFDLVAFFESIQDLNCFTEVRPSFTLTRTAAVPPLTSLNTETVEFAVACTGRPTLRIDDARKSRMASQRYRRERGQGPER
jgi:hypothetical protein